MRARGHGHRDVPVAVLGVLEVDLELGLAEDAREADLGQPRGVHQLGHVGVQGMEAVTDVEAPVIVPRVLDQGGAELLQDEDVGTEAGGDAELPEEGDHLVELGVEVGVGQVLDRDGVLDHVLSIHLSIVTLHGLSAARQRGTGGRAAQAGEHTWPRRQPGRDGTAPRCWSRSNRTG